MKWLRRGLLFFALTSVALLVAAWISTDHFLAFGGSPDAQSLARIRASPEFHGDRFADDQPRDEQVGLSQLRQWLFGDELRVPNCPLPLYPNTVTGLARPPASGLRVTWLGHSTTLIEIDGATILTDPNWGERASPSRWVGPKRFHPPPLPLNQLPHIDAVIISHDHYDHLDMDTVRALAARGAVFHVPLGIRGHLQAWGVPEGQIVEQDWWESSRISHDIQLISTPSRHFSGRGMPWRNGTHWTSWSLIGPQHRVYFSGDTGPSEEKFKQIASREGPFDLALIEIGQWDPSWGDIHLGPRGALDAATLLKPKLLIPIHWSTFELALHDWSEPAETLYTEAPKRGVPIATPMLGQPYEPESGIATPPWWRALPPTAAACPK